MSVAFPTDKDHIINELEDEYELGLTEEEYQRLRKLTAADLLLVTMLFSRSRKNRKTQEE